MPIPVGLAPDPSLGVIDRQSPYSLRINGVWVNLEGVVPGSSRTTTRPRSELVTVDGYQWAQQAPRGPREWSLSLTYAPAAVVAALALAAEAPGEVWLHDDAAARANMLHPADCYGTDPAEPVLDCGGVPLRALTVGVEVAAPVRGGTVTRLSCWTDADPGEDLVDVTFPGDGDPDEVTLSAPAGFGPRRAEVAFSAVSDGTVTVTPLAGVAVTGLALTEGPGTDRWLAGERTPCRVAVLDHDRVLNLLPTRNGDPLASRSDYAVTVREVG